jgi:hypothetical protein
MPGVPEPGSVDGFPIQELAEELELLDFGLESRKPMVKSQGELNVGTGRCIFPINLLADRLGGDG